MRRIIIHGWPLYDLLAQDNAWLRAFLVHCDEVEVRIVKRELKRRGRTLNEDPIAKEYR